MLPALGNVQMRTVNTTLITDIQVESGAVFVCRTLPIVIVVYVDGFFPQGPVPGGQR